VTTVSRRALQSPAAANARTVEATNPTTTKSSARGQKASPPAGTTASGAAEHALRTQSAFSPYGQSPALLISGLVGVWAAGSMGMLVLMLIRGWRFHRFLGQVAERDEMLERRASRLAYIVGLAARPQVVAVQGAVSPMLWGLGWTTRLIFPVELAR